MAKSTPEVNAGSMADIAFLLLIFFLVTTTMNVDSGISRILPPMVDENQNDAAKTKERNTFIVKVSGNDQVLVSGKRVDISAMKDMVKEFILNPTNSEDLPEKEDTQIELIGNFPVSKGIISLQNDRSTSFEAYLSVQNELTRAYNQVRNELSTKLFGATYGDLTDEQKVAINKAIPVRISEADPVDLTGGKK